MDDGKPERGPSKVYEASSGGLLRTPWALARIAGAAYWRSARWTCVASGRAARRVMNAAANGQAPAELFRTSRDEVRGYARRFLGLAARDEEPDEPNLEQAEREEARKSLREQGAELLRRSADVNFEEDAHPAYARIL
jgi:hypothetical protein